MTQCATCHQPAGARHKATKKRPSIKTMTRWEFDGIAEATDGCVVEPDGMCEHGHNSWIQLALMGG